MLWIKLHAGNNKFLENNSKVVTIFVNLMGGIKFMPNRKELGRGKSLANQLILVVTLIFTLMIIGCGTNQGNNPNTGAQSSQSQANKGISSPPTTENNQTSQTDTNKVSPQDKKDPIVTITMEDGNTIKIELFPTIAPNTVRNFISLIHKNFYNGLIFHRVIPGFMIQGGDPLGTGQGGPGYSIKGEFSSNGFNNSLKHERGVLSMARTSDPNSAGSQFFIMVANNSGLDGQYAAFGKVLEGMSEVDKIVNSKRDSNDKPLQDQKMKTVTVDTFGVNYPQPEVIK